MGGTRPGQDRFVVRDVMSTPVVTVPADLPVKLVAEVMLTNAVSAVPVVDAQGRPLGLISEADLLLKEIAGPSGAHLPWFESKQAAASRRRREALTAHHLMSTPLLSVHPEARLQQAAKLMYDKRIKRLPVVDGGSLVGIVSRSDVLSIYLIPDEHLQRRASRVLHGALGRDARDVQVGVQEGVVTVTGEVATHSEADFIPRLLSRLDGVLAVEVNVTWRIDDTVVDELKRLTHV